MAVSPRSADYERLEGGMGAASRAIPQRRFAWKKFAIGAAVIIGTVWLVGPRRPTSFSWKTGSVVPNTTYAPAAPPDSVYKPATSIYTPTPQPTAPPASFETDPDPSTTTYCTKPQSPTNPLVQYALMIDAGSTGSRIHIYKFNNCFSSPTFEWEVFHQTQPGLSDFHDDPDAGARSLDVLMHVAMRVVPASLRRCTPVALRATAGLRMLHGSSADVLLQAVDARLRRNWEFPVENVRVMDGKDEGVYAWITVNYLMGTLEAGYKGETYAVLDLGGASTQIAFEPKGEEGKGEGDHRFELTFAEREHVLYQHSYLGYGLMEARKRVHRLVDFIARSHPQDDLADELGNPCLAKTTSRTVELDDRNVTMVGEDIGSFEACLRLMEIVMSKDAICKTKPCSFNGVYQPSIPSTFPTGPIMLLSYFYDRLAPLLSSSSLDISILPTLARTICAGPRAWAEHSTTWDLEDIAGRPEYCLDLTFMYALLKRGYGFDDKRVMGVGKKVKGTELGWCLGAALGVVAGDLRCTD